MQRFRHFLICTAILLAEFGALALFVSASSVLYLYLGVYVFILNLLLWYVAKYYFTRSPSQEIVSESHTDEQEQFQINIAIAKKIQTHLLPEHFLRLPKLEIYAHSRPSDEMGGDFYQLIQENVPLPLLAIGDVAGHGLPSAMVSVMVDTLLHAFAKAADLKSLLININDVLYQRIDPALFTTMLLLRWNSELQHMNITSAGFGRFLHYNAREKQLYTITTKGVALGMVPSSRLSLGEVQCSLTAGDSLVICTDGILDMRNNLGERLGMERWKEIVSRHVHEENVETMFEKISQDLLSYAGTARQVDDITLMIMRSLC